MITVYWSTKSGLVFFAFVVALVLMASDSAEAKTRCFTVVGKILCHGNSSRVADAEIYLMDDDGPMNPDDTMGWTTTNEDGTFKLEGCGYDLMSDPDPYLKIFNTCNGDTLVKTRVDLPYTFAPDVIHKDDINLDL